ncbi:MAG: DUF1971 domain-containing protein [Novosphingobium sp.]
MEPYKVTRIWDQDTLPAAVRGQHSTKAGTWGLLKVLEGEVRLVFHEPPRSITVTPGNPGLITPEAYHHVETVGPMRMQVEFYHERPL